MIVMVRYEVVGNYHSTVTSAKLRLGLISAIAKALLDDSFDPTIFIAGDKKSCYKRRGKCGGKSQPQQLSY